MDYPELNKDLLAKTLAFTIKNKDHLRQAAWRCESGMCFGGNAATIAGGEWASNNLASSNFDRLVFDSMVDYAYDAISTFDQGKSVKTISCAARARAVLGLNRNEADVLFSGSNTLEHLEAAVAIMLDENYNRDIYDTIEVLSELAEGANA